MRRSYVLETTDTFSHDSVHINDLRANHLCQTRAMYKPGKPTPLDEAVHCKAWGWPGRRSPLS
jgi:hypothetical protein